MWIKGKSLHLGLDRSVRTHCTCSHNGLLVSSVWVKEVELGTRHHGQAFSYVLFSNQHIFALTHYHKVLLWPWWGFNTHTSHFLLFKVAIFHSHAVWTGNELVQFYWENSDMLYRFLPPIAPSAPCTASKMCHVWESRHQQCWEPVRRGCLRSTLTRHSLRQTASSTQQKKVAFREKSIEIWYVKLSFSQYLYLFMFIHCVVKGIWDYKA